ncbi:MAG TPA: hypothetical protein VHZ04_02145 [Candidatus Paceibacterota bacterium]|jgi:uncharacterized protein YoxC|nr:hypothetical protein [Candidatus Paceibacterota bacterium]
MDTLIHADIFFFVTTIAVVLVTIALIIALIYLIRVLRQVEEIGKEIKAETVLVREDIKELRDNVRREGFKLQHLYNFVTRLIKPKKSSASPRSKK